MTACFGLSHPTKTKHFSSWTGISKKKTVYTYSADSPSQLNTAEKTIKKPSLEDIQSQEFKLFNINELTGYLQESFLDAKTKSFENPQTIQLVDDNPLYNFARFYNSAFDFNDPTEIKTDSSEYNSDLFKKPTRKNLANITMFASKKTPGFETIKWDPSMQRDNKKVKYAKMLSDSIKNLDWSIAHRTPSKENSPPNFLTIESALTLAHQIGKAAINHGDVDKKLFRHDGFTFFTLQLDQKTFSNVFSKTAKIFEKQLLFKNIPFVSCSKYMVINLLKEEALKKVPFHSFHVYSDACFNGTSEEVKDQVTIYYINKLYASLGNKDDFNRPLAKLYKINFEGVIFT